MNLRIIQSVPLYLVLVLSLLPIHSNGRAEGLQAFSVGEILSPGFISTQADTARERPRPGSNRPAPPASEPGKEAVIPVPPPFPEREAEQQTLMWAIVTVAGIALLMAYLIFMMVRRDSRKKNKIQNPSKPKSAQSRKDGWIDTGERRGERDSTVIRTTIDPTLGGMTLAQDSKLPPITVIQSQWKDIQNNTVQKKEPTPGLEAIEVDAALKQSVEKAGYNPFYTTREAGIEVSEMGGDLPEAEVLMRMGFHDQAIQVLERMIADQEHPQPRIWLMLFELYRKTGLKEQYDELGKGFNTYFNAVAPIWDTSDPEAAKNLEDYPGVINKVVRLWGLQGCRMYLETLLYDNRSGTRQGFSLAAYDDILFLLDLIQIIKEIGDGGDGLSLQADAGT